eukprot:scaffold12990_cov99-Isochrysis_galbana.AAC.3
MGGVRFATVHFCRHLPLPAGAGVERLRHGAGFEVLQKACRASARTLRAAAPFGRLHLTQQPLSDSVDATGALAWAQPLPPCHAIWLGRMAYDVPNPNQPNKKRKIGRPQR